VEEKMIILRLVSYKSYGMLYGLSYIPQTILTTDESRLTTIWSTITFPCSWIRWVAEIWGTWVLAIRVGEIIDKIGKTHWTFAVTMTFAHSAGTVFGQPAKIPRGLSFTTSWCRTPKLSNQEGTMMNHWVVCSHF
jgi:hypothetical protein